MMLRFWLLLTTLMVLGDDENSESDEEDNCSTSSSTEAPDDLHKDVILEDDMSGSIQRIDDSGYHILLADNNVRVISEADAHLGIARAKLESESSEEEDERLRRLPQADDAGKPTHFKSVARSIDAWWCCSAGRRRRKRSRHAVRSDDDDDEDYTPPPNAAAAGSAPAPASDPPPPNLASKPKCGLCDGEAGFASFATVGPQSQKLPMPSHAVTRGKIQGRHMHVHGEHG